MLGLAIVLYNVDHEVMSVAIVPLSLAHSSTQFFSRIVQIAISLSIAYWKTSGFFLVFVKL